MRVKDAGKKHDVVVVCSPNVNPGYRLVDNKDYPEIAADFEKSFQFWKTLPCDIFLGAHGNYYGMDDKYPRLAPARARTRSSIPPGYKAYIEEREQAFRKRLAEQQAPQASGVQPGR